MKVIGITLAAGLLSAGALRLEAELINGIQALVHDSVITKEAVDELTAQTADVVRRQSRDAETFQKKMEQAQQENLDKLLERELILHDFATAGYNLPETVIDEIVQQRIRSQYGDQRKLTKTLQAEGITRERFRQRMREQFIIEAMRQKNISSEIIISPFKVETYYRQHPEEFKVEEEVKLRTILLKPSVDPVAPDPEKLAAEILLKIKEGVSFADMAKEFSQGPERSQGGARDWAEVRDLRKELADAIGGLKPGEVSGVVKAGDVFWLLQVEDRRPARIRPISEVRESIERTLKTQEQDRLHKQWIDKLKKKTFVRYY